MISLERTSKKLSCPNCGQRTFKRYISEETRDILAADVGRCDRQDSCGYHYSPRQYYADNPPEHGNERRCETSGTNRGAHAGAGINAQEQIQQVFSYLEKEHLINTLKGGINSFTLFLLKSFLDDDDLVKINLKKYFIGTYEDYCSFPYIDVARNIRGAKLIRFNPDTPTCKRLRGQYDTSSLQSQLKRKGIIPPNLEFRQCFFGEHLIPDYPDHPVAVVESEKSAVVGSICLGQYVWIATGSKQALKVEKLLKLPKRKYIFYPDADGFGEWSNVAQEMRDRNYQVVVSKAIENATAGEKSSLDIADVFLLKQYELNEQNELINKYNQKLDLVMQTPALFESFKAMHDERLKLEGVEVLPNSAVRWLVELVAENAGNVTQENVTTRETQNAR